MTPSNSPGRPGRFLLILTVLIVLPGAGVLGIASYFRLSSDARALRDGVFATFQCEPARTIDISVGRATMAAIRAGSGFFSIPHEAAVALGSVRSIEAGRYQVLGPVPDGRRLVAAADAAMSKRGWVRTVTVLQQEHLVLVYMPKESAKQDLLECCALVMADGNLVVGSLRGNLQGVADIAFAKLHEHRTPGIAFAAR
jgi:hypothetical protein